MKNQQSNIVAIDINAVKRNAERFNDCRILSLTPSRSQSVTLKGGEA